MATHRIAVLATLDTKSVEAGFLAREISRRGYQPCLIDISLTASAEASGKVTHAEVVRASGHSNSSFDQLDKISAMLAVIAGATHLISDLPATAAPVGIIGIGGGQGTWLATAIMRSLPLGMPKVMVSTVAHRADRYSGSSDITFMPSVADISGINRILGPVLVRAAGAITGMVSAKQSPSDGAAPLVAMSMFGVTTEGGNLLRQWLERDGFEVAVFHANGTGGAVMEKLCSEGAFTGLLDWTTTELADELVGGTASAGADRLEAAGQAGIPQLFVPGALDVVNFAAADQIPRHYANRIFHRHTPTGRLMRTDQLESARLGQVVSQKLNNAAGPTRVLIPLGGFSALDAPGAPFYDPDADAAFVDELRTGLRPDIPFDVVDAHINSSAFAHRAARAMRDLLVSVSG